MSNLLSGGSTLAFNKTSAPAGFNSGAFSDVDPATVAGVSALAVTGGAALVGAAVLPGQVAVGVATGGLFVGLGEVSRRTGSYLPSLTKEGRERNQHVLTVSKLSVTRKLTHCCCALTPLRRGFSIAFLGLNFVHLPFYLL